MNVLLIKTSLIVIIVLGFYKVLIEKESFFSTNRMYLVLGLLLTFAIPFVSLPKLINNQGFVSELIESSMSQTSNFKNVNNENRNDNLNAKSIKSTTIQQATNDVVVTTESSRSLLDWLFIVYLFGVVVLTINLMAQIGNLVFKIIRSKDKIKDTDATIINSLSIKEPCSFFNYIFINPEQYEFEIYRQIITHEKIHVKKKHSLDLLLSEIAVILLWFNPFIWLFRKEVEKNIEYQTDHLVIDTKSAEKGSYQMNLLKIATFNKPLTITTNYNQSLIKQRILKMNSKKSNPHSYWKYAFTLPMFFALLLLLNKPYSAFGQQEQPSLNNALKGDDINHYSQNQGNALIAASRNGQKETVKLLLENGADINAQNNSQGSALNAAARRGHLDTVKLLLEKGADINLQNNGQGSALNAAARNGHLDTVKLLLEKRADINLQNTRQGSALNAAARRGHLDIVKLLLEKGADINLQNDGQGSALNAAATNGHLNTVKLLLEKGADINLQNTRQGTALDAATRNGHLDTVKLLLEKGADINL
jgi:ankyrin repeat protein